MAEVNALSLVMAIQAIREVEENLEKEIAALPEDHKETADLQELQLSYWKSRMELRRAYEMEWSPDTNLPPLEQFDKEG